MKVVLDCNVVVAAARGHRPGRTTSRDRPVCAHSAGLRNRCQAPQRDTLRFVIGEIERLAVTVEPANLMFGLRDPDDEVYLATSAAGGAILITGNTQDFTQPRYGPVEILSPRLFLDRTAGPVLRPRCLDADAFRGWEDRAEISCLDKAPTRCGHVAPGA